MGLKRWNGTAWVDVTVSRRSGGGWVAGNAKYWNGSAWVPEPVTGITVVAAATHAQTTNAACSITKFPALADGDVIVGFWSKYEDTSDSGLATGNVAAWDRLSWFWDTNGTDRTRSVYVHVVSSAAAEPAAWTHGHADSAGHAHVLSLVAFRGVDNVTPIDVGGASTANLNDPDPVIAGPTTVTDGAYVLYHVTEAFDSSGTWTAPSVGTLLASYSGAGAAAINHGVAGFLKPTAGPAGNLQFFNGASAGVDNITRTLALRPAA